MLRGISDDSRDDSWISRGKCHPSRPDAPPLKFFFPPRTNVSANEAAVKFCYDGCPVREQCLEYAVEVVDAGVPGNFLTGVYGGTTPQQRSRLRRARRRAK